MPFTTKTRPNKGMLIAGLVFFITLLPFFAPKKSAALLSDFIVYSDKNSANNHYIPSGWMGDTGDISINEQSTNNPHSVTTCLQFIYSSKRSQGQGWAGVYWQNPANNWGTVKGGYDLRGMIKLTFWARGEKGGEIIQKFMTGGITGAYPDSTSVETGLIQLSAAWNKYTIDLTDKDLSYINGGFGWIIASYYNPAGATFYIDDIKFEPDITPPVAPVITPVTSPTNFNSQTISGTKSTDTSAISITCGTASVGNVTYPSSTSWSCPITNLSQGTNTITVKALDFAGNISAPATASIISDTTPPTGSLQINSGAKYTAATSVTLNLSAQDTGSGLSQMQFSNDNSSWSAPEIFAASRSWGITASNGTKTVYVKFKDVAGNWSGSFSNTIVLDTTAPTGCSIKINNGATGTNSATVTLNLSASDPSGVTQMFFYGNAAPEPYSAAKTWTLSAGDGAKIVWVMFGDAAGNWSGWTSATISLDSTAPTGTISINSGANSTGNTNVTLTLSASDTGGVTQMQFSNDNATWSTPENYAVTKAWSVTNGDGLKTVYVKYKDTAGNWSAAIPATISLDLIPPVISSAKAENITANSASISWQANKPATPEVEYGATTAYGAKTAATGTFSVSGTNTTTTIYIEDLYEKEVSQ